MKHEAMMGMSATELDEYAAVLGIDVSGKRTVGEKAEEIERRRGRTAEVDVLGMTVTVPVKRLRDKRVTDLAGKRQMTDEDASELLGLLAGPEQEEMIVERATDEDGTVDVDALALALARMLGSEELKNY